MKYLLITFLFLSGCATTSYYDYECYKVQGPQITHGSSEKSEMEKTVRKVDGHIDLFGDKPTSYICIDTTPVPQIRDYPRGK